MAKALYTNELHTPGPGTMAGKIYIACMLARQFTTKQPAPIALQRQFGMSRATAYRWTRAWKEANGVM